MFVHARWMHAFFSLPGPPNFGLSQQYLHVLQLTRSSHLTRLWPIEKLTMGGIVLCTINICCNLFVSILSACGNLVGLLSSWGDIHASIVIVI